MKLNLTIFFCLFGMGLSAQRFFHSSNGDNNINATGYFISNSGLTTNTGKSASSPWPFSKLNSPIDTTYSNNVFFNKGETFYGSIPGYSGSATKTITYGSYGTGANPIISGFTTLSGWTLSSGNIYYATLNATNLNMVTVNGAVKGMGRYPNTGYRNYKTHTANTSITDTTLNGSWVGGEVVIRKYRWIIDRHTITAQTGGTLTYNALASYGNNNAYSPVDGNGYFIQGHLSTLDQNGEWYYDTTAKRLYMYNVGGMAGLTVKASTINKLAWTGSYVSFNNIDFEGGNYAISVEGASNVTANNVNFRQQGATAIYANGSTNVTINGGSISDALNNGIFGEYNANNFTVNGVAVLNCGVIAGAGSSGDGSYAGISINGTGNTITGNTVRRSGYNGIAFTGNNALIEKNLVDSFCITKDDGGGIYTVISSSGVTASNRIVRNNTVLNAVGAFAGAESYIYENFGKAAGIYLDDYTNNVTVTSNTVAHGPWIGIFHNGGTANTITNNLAYDFASQLQLNSYSGRTVRNLLITGNQLIARTATQKTLYVQLWFNDSPSLWGTINNNYYARPIEDSLTVTLDKQYSGGGGPVNMTLATWKSTYSQDAATTKSPIAITSDADLRFEYNATANSNTVALTGSYLDVKNNSYTGTVTILPYISLLLLRQATAFAYTLAAPATTSAGVYKTDGTLVRTLWSGESKLAGTYTVKWDGTNDTLATLPVDNYNIKVLSNNITYDWQGIIGNTSLRQTGNTVHRSLDPAVAIITAGNNAYYAVGYGEGEGGNGMFSFDSIQVKSHAMNYEESGQNTDFMTTDGTNIYWAGFDAFQPEHSFLFATKVSDKSEVSFSSGVNVPVTYAHTYSSAVSYEDGLRADSSFTFNSNLATTYTLTDPFPELYIYKVEITVGNNIVTINSDKLTISNNNRTVKIDDLSGANPPNGSTLKIIYWQKRWITGIAVNSGYIFIARKNLNEVVVLNKVTGALLQRLTFTTPGAMCVNNSTMWLCTGINTVTKYTIGTNGTLTSTGTVLSGFIQPITMSTNGTLVALVDGGSSQQIKAFDFSTGAAQWVLGQVGGHISSPVVANDRFGFWKLQDDATKQPYGAVAFQSDGSFWVCDPANFKIAHFSANRTYIEGILYTGRSYSIAVDLANPTRLINTMHDYEVSYGSDIKTSWIYKYNWQGNARNGYDLLQQIRHMCTLSNGRTYATMRQRTTGKTEIIELDPTTGIRYTGITFDNAVKIYADGSIGEMQNDGVGQTQYFRKRTLTGFSGNDPVYSAATQIAAYSNTGTNEPRNGSVTIYPTEITSSGILALYKGGRVKGESNSYHLGGFDIATGAVKWKTALPTFDAYAGDFPNNGDFEVGNFGANDGSQGSAAMAIEKSIFTQYFGEFWKNSQTNIFNQYYDNGLFVGQFGTTGDDVTELAGAGMAGNAFSPVVVKVGSDYYMYHNDESHHGGTHRWKISNLSSVAVQTIPIDTTFVRSSETHVLAGTDLMAGLPYRSTNLPASVGAITRFPVTNEAGWNVITNSRVYSKKSNPDVYAEWSATKNCNIAIDLGSNSNLTNWKVGGIVAFASSMPSEGNKMVIKVLDASGKIMAQFNRDIDFGNFMISYKANATVMGTVKQSKYELKERKDQVLEFSRSGSNIMYKFSDYAPVTIPLVDGTASIGSPKTFIIEFQYSGGTIYGKNISIKDMRFFNN
jgi:hypothetical protein